MQPRPHAAEEGLLSWVERWAPADAEVWSRWRRSLSAKERADVLLPLQASLSGLVAFRQLENHPSAGAATDFRPHLHAVRVTYDWALALCGGLCADREPERRLRSVGRPIGEPEASLQSLRRSLTDALRVSERLLDLPLVDAGAFQASCDLFLRDLGRNAFFRPPEPLEFSNVAELVGPDHFPAELASWTTEVAKTTTIIAFLALLRNHRFMGIADRLIGEDEGLYRAHVVLAGVRKELRTLTRFLLVQGIETFADELEARLLAVDAHHITGARTEITKASKELTELREAVETLAMGIHGKVRSALEDPLPELEDERRLALPSERMRNGIREVRATVKESAKRLRSIALPAAKEHEVRRSERVQKNLQQDIWAFRFILRAFIDKALVAPLGADRWNHGEDLAFAGEFVRHFRVFGPRLAKGTGYPRLGPLTRAVSALSYREAIEAAKLGLAAHECELFVEHLESVLGDAPHSLLAPFDKERAAAELRGYLAAAQDRSALERAPTGTFGLTGAEQAEAG